MDFRSLVLRMDSAKNKTSRQAHRSATRFLCTNFQSFFFCWWGWTAILDGESVQPHGPTCRVWRRFRSAWAVAYMAAKIYYRSLVKQCPVAFRFCFKSKPPSNHLQTFLKVSFQAACLLFMAGLLLRPRKARFPHGHTRKTPNKS